MDGVTGLGWTFVYGMILFVAYGIALIPCLLVGGVCGRLMRGLSVRRGLVCGLVSSLSLAVVMLSQGYLSDSALSWVFKVWRLWDFMLVFWAVSSTSGLCYWWAYRRRHDSRGSIGGGGRV